MSGDVATDRDAIKAMFDRAGIVWKEEHEDDGRWSVEVRQGDGPKNLGYLDFFAVIYFTADGALDAIEVWE